MVEGDAFHFVGELAVGCYVVFFAAEFFVAGAFRGGDLAEDAGGVLDVVFGGEVDALGYGLDFGVDVVLVDFARDDRVGVVGFNGLDGCVVYGWYGQGGWPGRSASWVLTFFLRGSDFGGDSLLRHAGWNCDVISFCCRVRRWGNIPECGLC